MYQKMACEKGLGKQGPAGEKEYSFTRDVGRNVFHFKMP